MPSVAVLRAAGHNVAALGFDRATWSDPTILDAARAEHRTLLTFDRDFGEMMFRHGHPPCPGLIHLRMATASPDLPAHRILELLADPEARV
jgi:predicted nuclease of predicted toxin-antitoxin system